MNNPLLDFSGLPRFADFKPEYVAPAMDALLAENRALIDKLVADKTTPTWENFAAPLFDAGEKLNRAWGQVGHLNAVMNSAELREAYNATLPKITQFYTELGQHQGLFEKFRLLSAMPAFEQLTRAQKKIIENELRDFRLGGAELPPEKKERYTEISERLSEITSRFSDNLLDATNAWTHNVTDKKSLAGIPDDVLEAARAAAEEAKQAGWTFTLHMPSYFPVLQYADDRALRETLYRANATRASEFGKPEWDNTPLMDEIVALRKEIAQLLGFTDYAEYSLATKMAASPQEVLDFLNDLATRAKPYAERDLEELRAFASKELGLNDLQAWDVPYVSEKLRIARYAFSDQEVKQYFPETKVLPGMFRLVETLYGLTIKPASAPLWHDDVRYFELRQKDDTLVGGFYLDLYARPSKRGGAWMDEAITRRRVSNDKTNAGIQAPIAYLNCNFSAPVGNKPALFTHDEVITLFHEFGHGLHHLLTQVEELGVSGINGVEWDAVELPSQFMENFCWEWDVLQHMTAHADTGKPLPRDLYDKMIAAKNFQSGMQTVRQIEFALFDMHLHHDYDAKKQTIASLLDDVRKQVAVIIPPAFNRFAQSFSHIFAGGYAAGYYSYKWAEVLSADAYSLFEEYGVLDADIGARFRDEILAVGGSRPALESFVAFRGRAPQLDALLRHNGMTESTAA